ncbi:DUF2231 domain-containing protein [Nocardioides bruguierae]|uniref:DUF2231 domain-containing protein n=1 Tax=Nocardioides bruguierae TaxID=2945102 RepID=A0A9X2D4L8_9ACTN|nr:DUF2231 domain-containing protein [Nocardioides bruguierae]MCM0619287.1 hypothetical protein [Nocardioides bruguierae]
MLDLVNGLPVHPLVVHAVVVLLPLAVLGAIAVAVRPAWAHRVGWLVVAVAAVATVLVPVATSSGEALERRVGDPGEHAELGDQLIWFALPLLVLTIAVVLLGRRRATGAATPGPGWLPTAVAVLTVLVALATAVQVYRVGESGARAVWGDEVASASTR